MIIEKEMKMMKFDLYQFVLTNEMIDEVNTPDRKEYPDFYKKYMDVTWKPTAEAILAAKEYFVKVAEIDARNFEDVFTVGNVGPEGQINRLAPMHSISVGDVVVCDGVAKFVAPMGFDSVAFI
jgi:hypothetical protein